MEIQWIVDDSHDSSKFKPYSSGWGSYQHRETKLIISDHWLGVPGFGSVRNYVHLTNDELAEVRKAFQRLHRNRQQMQEAKIWANVQGRFKKRARAMYRFICDKAGIAHH